jgi:hypothetical protein
MSTKRAYTKRDGLDCYDVEMFAYPTGNPTYIMSISDKTTGKKLYSTTYTGSMESTAATFTDVIREALDAEDPGAFEDDLDRIQYFRLRKMCHKHLSMTMERLFLQAASFKCDAVNCHYDAHMMCYGKNRPMDGLMMVLDCIPDDAEWSDTNSIGMHKDGKFQWVKAPFCMAWSMNVGYPIMMERLRRALDCKLQDKRGGAHEAEGAERPENEGVEEGGPAKRVRVEEGSSVN